MLQWGRDLSVAEGRRYRQGRRIVHSFNGAATFRSRKEKPWTPPAGRTTSGFNGAATFRSRKGYSTRRSPPPQQGFNGAATFRSRKGRAPRWGASGMALLQWGRDLSVAEGATLISDLRRVLKASMGPRPFGRGRSAAAPTVVWMSRGFNGAATFRSRKVGESAGIEEVIMASMGPRPFGRGRFARLLQDAQRRRASMGPRPFGRGRGIPKAAGRHRPQRLQWGRDLSVAEG